MICLSIRLFSENFIGLATGQIENKELILFGEIHAIADAKRSLDVCRKSEFKVQRFEFREFAGFPVVQVGVDVTTGKQIQITAVEEHCVYKGWQWTREEFVQFKTSD